MLYQMKKNFWSLLGNFSVKDEFGEIAFRIERCWGFNKYSFIDETGREQVVLKQKIWSLQKTFEIFANGQFYARFTRPFFTFYNNYSVALYDGNDLRVEGDFFGCEYNIYRVRGGGSASVSKRWFTLVDTYGIDIDVNEDRALILACVLAIDLCHTRSNEGDGWKLIGGLLDIFFRS